MIARWSRWAFPAIMLSVVFSACGPSYKRENIKEEVRRIAEKEYGLKVDVREEGGTLGLRFSTPNLIGELTSGSEETYRKINGLFTVLVRVVLSTDRPPEFIVLDMVDADNPNFRLVFTRYIVDLKKSMAEALSYSQTQDRLIEEFVINGRHIPFDPQEMDLVRLMLMAMDSKSDTSTTTSSTYTLKPVELKYFLERVSENVARRALKEKDDISDATVLRQINARFEKSEDGQLRILLDMVSKPSLPLAPSFIQDTILPLAANEVAALLKSYRFKDFSGITVIEKNTGKMFSLPS